MHKLCESFQSAAWSCWHSFALFCPNRNDVSGSQPTIVRSSSYTRIQELAAGLLGVVVGVMLLGSAVLLSIIAAIASQLQAKAQTFWSWITSDPLVTKCMLGTAIPTGYFSSLSRSIWFYVLLLSFVFFIPWVCLFVYLHYVPLDGFLSSADAYQELWQDEGLRCCGGLLLCSGIVSLCLGTAYQSK